MADRERTLQVYQELSDSFERQHNPSMRDLFLMLAADAALHAGHTAEAELLRQRLLRLNPHHLLKPYTSFAEAAGHPDIQSYIEELRQKYPAEVAEEMLESALPHDLDIDLGDIPATMPPTPRSRLRPPTVTPPAGDDQTYRLRPEPEPPLPVSGPPPVPNLAETQPLPSEGEPLKVYRLHPEVEETKPPAPRPAARPPERPAPRKPTPRPAPPSPLEETMPPRPAVPASRPKPAAARVPTTRPIAPAPAPRRAPVPEPRRPAQPRPEPPAEEQPLMGGAWVGVILSVLLLLLGLALILHTLVPQLFPERLFPLPF